MSEFKYNTVIETFEGVLESLQSSLEYSSIFSKKHLCLILDDFNIEMEISDKLYCEVDNILEKNKPSEVLFKKHYDGEFFLKDSIYSGSWWLWYSHHNKRHGNDKEILEARIAYLQDLIEHLKANGHA